MQLSRTWWIQIPYWKNGIYSRFTYITTTFLDLYSEFKQVKPKANDFDITKLEMTNFPEKTKICKRPDRMSEEKPADAL